MSDHYHNLEHQRKINRMFFLKCQTELNKCKPQHTQCQRNKLWHKTWIIFEKNVHELNRFQSQACGQF